MNLEMAHRPAHERMMHGSSSSTCSGAGLQAGLNSHLGSDAAVTERVQSILLCPCYCAASCVPTNVCAGRCPLCLLQTVEHTMYPEKRPGTCLSWGGTGPCRSLGERALKTCTSSGKIEATAIGTKQQTHCCCGVCAPAPPVGTAILLLFVCGSAARCTRREQERIFAV